MQKEPALMRVARGLAVSEDDLRKAREETASYRRTFIPKRGGKGKKRVLHVPPDSLKGIQKRIHQGMQRYPFPKSMHGFIPGRSHVTAARSHCGAKALLTVDFKNAFDTVKRDWVYQMFAVRFKFDIEIASLLADLATHNGRLPQGAPSSPLIFNLVILDLVKQLEGFARTREYAVTFYADEVAISAKTPISTEDRAKVVAFCRGAGFRVAPEKVRYQEARWGEIELTSVLVRDRALGLSNRKIVDHVRARITNLLRKPRISETEMQAVEGWVGWIAHVEPKKLQTRLKKPLQELRNRIYH